MQRAFLSNPSRVAEELREIFLESGDSVSRCASRTLGGYSHEFRALVHLRDDQRSIQCRKIVGGVGEDFQILATVKSPKARTPALAPPRMQLLSPQPFPAGGIDYDLMVPRRKVMQLRRDCYCAPFCDCRIRHIVPEKMLACAVGGTLQASSIAR